ncbi:MAG: FAD:protein FMN transferase [Pedosphaera sp.]|nr:FAD:protein FMN transferase [Pedosphaera sp.]
MGLWLTAPLFLWILLGVGCATRPGVTWQRYEFERPQMGLPFRMVLYTTDGQAATNAAEAAWKRIAELNSILSDYLEQSELSRLSRTAGSGRAIPVGQDLWRVLVRSEKMSRASDGTFDVTVGPLVQLWRRARRQRALPEPDRITAARAAVNWRWIELESRARSVRLVTPGMRLDLGAIAKGYALDEALAVLRHRGVSRALVSGGGDMVVGGPPPGELGWKVAVAPLDVLGAPPPRTVWLRWTALCTSGDVFQHVEIGGVRYSHIVDPRTGVGLTDHSLVTVIARRAVTADALSTAVSVLGPIAGIELVERMRSADALLVRPAESEGEQSFQTAETAGFRRWERRR